MARGDAAFVSTGALPGPAEVARLVDEAYRRFEPRPHGRGVGRVPGAAHSRPGPLRHRRHGGDGRNPLRG